MNTNKKLKALVEHGFKPSTLLKLTESQLDMMYFRLMEQGGVEGATPTTSYQAPAGQKKIVIPTGGKQKVTVTSSSKGLTLTPESEMKEEMDFIKGKNKKEVKEKSLSKQQQKFMGLAYSVKKGDTPKSEVSKDIKKAAERMSSKELKKFAKTKHKGLPQKKETKENYLEMIGRGLQNQYRLGLDGIKPDVVWESSVRNNIERMINKHVTPKISKKDFIKYITETAKDSDTKESPTKPKTKPTTKPKKDPKPDESPYRREKQKDAPSPSPKAKKTETKESSMNAPTIKPKTPTIKPGTKPKPKTPPSPYTIPGPAPAPKAGKRDLPNWLSFDSIGLKF